MTSASTSIGPTRDPARTPGRNRAWKALPRVAPRRRPVILLCWLVPSLLYLYGVFNAPHFQGADLIPNPDAGEYALLATRLARFQAPLIGLGLYDYPSRYTLAYPLLLTPFAWLFHFNMSHYWQASALFGLVAVLLLVRVGRWLTGSRLTGTLAATLFALHPQTVWAGTHNMSETALIAMFLLMLELARPWLEPPRPQASTPVTPSGWRGALLGLTVGWLTVAKAPFVYWALVWTALTWARALGRPDEAKRFRAPVALVLAGLACAGGDALFRRWAYGSWGINGYSYWFPPIYAEFLRTFNTQYLWSCWNHLDPMGNLAYYGWALLGRMDQPDTFYGKYIPWALAAAALGLVWPGRRGRPVGLAVGLLAGWAVVGVLFCALYFFQSFRFPYLWIPLVDLLAAWGLVRVPCWEPLRHWRIGHGALAVCWRPWRWARAGAALIALMLARGELIRVQGYYVHSPARQTVPFITRIKPLLKKVPKGAWLLSNYMPSAVDVYRPHPGPTGSLYSWDKDQSWPLANDHAYSVWCFNLMPRRTRPGLEHELETAPQAWRSGVTQLIQPDGTWTLTPEERQALVSRPVYVLVVRPAGPIAQFSVDHCNATILPMLRLEYQVKVKARAIHQEGNVTLYRLEPRAARP